MSEFKKISTVDELKFIEETEMVEGYRYALDGGAICGSDRSRSFWHGFRNGLVDSGRADQDDAQKKLAHEFVERSRYVQ